MSGKLVKEMLERYPVIAGCQLTFEHPGYFQLRREGRCVCFSPDWDGEAGTVEFQTFTEDGSECLDTFSVAYGSGGGGGGKELTPEALFDALMQAWSRL